jgi:hypothetical protein
MKRDREEADEMILNEPSSKVPRYTEPKVVYVTRDEMDRQNAIYEQVIQNMHNRLLALEQACKHQWNAVARPCGLEYQY